MSYKARFIKIAIKLTPNKIVLWVANIILKGIAELKDFSFDLDTRKAYAQIQLYGEMETIEVWLDDFAVISDGESYQFILQQAQSNRPWLTNLLSHVVGKAWLIPVPPQFKAQAELVHELLKVQTSEPENK